MAQDINVVTIVGRLTRDSELRYSQNGVAITRFSIAVNRRSFNNAKESDVSYFNVVNFGKLGEAIQRYLVKGRQVCIGGELRQNKYEVDGQTRSSIDIIANNIQLIGGNDRTQNFEQGQRPVQNQNMTSNQNMVNSIDMDDIGPEDFDDDIPF